MVCGKSGNSSADALFTQGLMAVMQPIICCVRAQSAREFVTEFSPFFTCVPFLTPHTFLPQRSANEAAGCHVC
jgi:hypothetical protein